jgi:hypothetical protein
MSSLKTAETVGFDSPTTRAAWERDSAPRSCSASTTDRWLIVRAIAGVALAKLRYSAICLPSREPGAPSGERRHCMSQPARRQGWVA